MVVGLRVFFLLEPGVRSWDGLRTVLRSACV